MHLREVHFMGWFAIVLVPCTRKFKFIFAVKLFHISYRYHLDVAASVPLGTCKFIKIHNSRLYCDGLTELTECVKIEKFVEKIFGRDKLITECNIIAFHFHLRKKYTYIYNTQNAEKKKKKREKRNARMRYHSRSWRSSILRYWSNINNYICIIV